jgi:hypothetical protein
MERRDEWEVATDVNQREVARAKVRLAALEQYHASLAESGARGDAGVTEIAFDEARMAGLEALAEELSEARMAHDEALVRFAMIAEMRPEREEAQAGA